MTLLDVKAPSHVQNSHNPLISGLVLNFPGVWVALLEKRAGKIKPPDMLRETPLKTHGILARFPQYLLLMLSLLACNRHCFAVSARQAAASEAVLMDEAWQGELVPLAGPWMFYPFVLLHAGDPATKDSPLLMGEEVTVPHLWHANGAAVGFGTYVTRVIVPATMQGQQLGLWMPDAYSNFNIWIDGKRYPGNGVVSSVSDESVPAWKPEKILFTPSSNQFEIIIQVSNFHHHRGGLGKPIMFGAADEVERQFDSAVITGCCLVAVLIFMTVASLVMYQSKYNRTLLYFALFSLSWAFRSSFSNNYLVIQYLPNLEWVSVVRVEYISLYLSTLFGLLFASSLFPKDFGFRVQMLYVTVALIFTMVTLLTPPIFFTTYVYFYLAFSASALIAIFIVLIRAFVNDRRGSSLLLMCLLIGVILLMYVILAYLNYLAFSDVFFNLGFLVLSVLTGGSLLYLQYQTVAGPSPKIQIR